MNRYFCVLILLFMPLLSSANGSIDQIRIKQKNDIVSVKMWLNSPMYGQEETRVKETYPNYISNITAKIDSKIVFDFSSSSNIRRKPIIKFKFNNPTKKNIVDITITHNNGKQEKQSFLINTNKHYNSNNMPKIITSSIPINAIRHVTEKAWKATTVGNAISELFGSYKIIDETNNKQICGLYSSIPLHVKSTIDYKSIAILQDVNPQALVALFNISDNQIIDYEVFLKMRTAGTITIIYQNRKDELFITSQPVVVSGTMSHMSCVDNQLVNDFD